MTRIQLSLATALALTLGAGITSAQPPPTTRTPRPRPARTDEPAILTPAPFRFGATRAQAIRACAGTAEDDTRTAVTCSPGGIWPEDTPHQPFVVGTLCGSTVCRIDVEIYDGTLATAVIAPARAAATRLGAAFGTGTDGGDDAACATALFGGDDACFLALAPGRAIWRRWTIPGGGWVRVRLRALGNGMARYLESYVDARAEAAGIEDPDD